MTQQCISTHSNHASCCSAVRARTYAAPHCICWAAASALDFGMSILKAQSSYTWNQCIQGCGAVRSLCSYGLMPQQNLGQCEHMQFAGINIWTAPFHAHLLCAVHQKMKVVAEQHMHSTAMQLTLPNVSPHGTVELHSVISASGSTVKPLRGPGGCRAVSMLCMQLENAFRRRANISSQVRQPWGELSSASRKTGCTSAACI